MKTSDYQQSLSINSADKEIFESLTSRIPEWWTEKFEGSAKKVSEKFTVHFGGTLKTMLIEEAAPNKKVVWRCIDAYIDVNEFENKKEWIGTKIIWEIVPDSPNTKLNLTHEGLTSDFECYSVCIKGWDFFLQSLFELLVNGKGMPNKN